MPTALEVWFVPSGGMSGGRVLLQTRMLGQGERPPALFDLSYERFLVAVRTRHEHRNGASVCIVEMVDPHYALESDEDLPTSEELRI